MIKKFLFKGIKVWITLNVLSFAVSGWLDMVRDIVEHESFPEEGKFINRVSKTLDRVWERDLENYEIICKYFTR